MTDSGRIQPHNRAESKIARVRLFCRSQDLTCGSGEWGGWGSNPRPTDYESRPPAAGVRVSDLGRRELTRSWLRPPWHVFGMIKLDADR